MKPFSASILVPASLALLSACSAEQASVTDTDWTMDEEVTSSAHSGPYLEMDDEGEDSVELDINSSSSSITQP